MRHTPTLRHQFRRHIHFPAIPSSRMVNETSGHICRTAPNGLRPPSHHPSHLRHNLPVHLKTTTTIFIIIMINYATSIFT